jgi:hypothetical protein
MRDDETSVSYCAARKMGIAQRVKNSWKKEVSRRRVSRQTLALCLKDWREGKNELIVDKDIILKDWGIGKPRKRLNK